MKNPAPSLLARARAYAGQRAGRTALTIAPLAALGLTANRADAISAGPVFNPSPSTTYGPYNQDIFYNNSGGSITGSALAKGSNGVTGVKLQGSSSFTEYEGGYAGMIGTITMFTTTGTASGTLNAGDASIPVHYNFTLATTALNDNSLTIGGWTLSLALTTSGTGGGTNTTFVNGTGGGTFNSTALVTALGAANGTTLTGYSASLSVNYTINGNDQGASLSVTIPANSIDFNAAPEPSTWVILATGVAGAGFQVMRVRERRAKAAPII